MNIKKRIENLETNSPGKPNCFCSKTLIDLWYKPGAGALTYCPKCKDKFDQWAKISAEAAEVNNLTDEVL